jgi:hypothetical protein
VPWTPFKALFGGWSGLPGAVKGRFPAIATAPALG